MAATYSNGERRKKRERSLALGPKQPRKPRWSNAERPWLVPSRRYRGTCINFIYTVRVELYRVLQCAATMLAATNVNSATVANGTQYALLPVNLWKVAFDMIFIKKNGHTAKNPKNKKSIHTGFFLCVNLMSTPAGSEEREGGGVGDTADDCMRGPSDSEGR